MEARHRATLQAVIDCIIPADDWPSASANAVDVFIARIIETDQRARRIDLIGGLAALDADALSMAQLPFDSLHPAQQIELLTAIENDPARAPWFDTLIQLTNEGFYADRSNGANPEHISWKMIGYNPRLPTGLI